MLVFLVGAVAGWLLKPDQEIIHSTTVTKTLHDTAWVVREVPRFILQKTEAEIRYDTTRETIETAPFYASLDTNIDRVSASILYRWPENNFDVDVKVKPDSVQVISSHTTSTETVVVKDDERFGISLCAGYAWGVPEITRQVPLLSPENIRFGVMATFDIIKW